MSNPIPTTVADYALLTAIRGSTDDATALQHIATARVEATVSIAHLYSETRDRLVLEQARAAQLWVILEQQTKAVRDAMARFKS